MAVVVTVVGTGTSATATLTSSSFTPTANSMLVVYVTTARVFATPDTPVSFAGGSLTYTFVTGTNNTYSSGGGLATARAYWVTAPVGGSPGSMTVTCNTGTGPPSGWIIVFQVTGGKMSAPVVQVKFATAASGSSAINTGNFGAGMQSDSGVLAGFGIDNDTATFTAGSGYTLLGSNVTITGNGSIRGEWRNDPDPTPNADATVSTNVGWAVTGLELKAQDALSLSGTLTTAGVVKYQASKFFGGTLTTAGVLTKLRTSFVNAAGTLTTSGALIKSVAKTFTGTLTTSGALIKKVLKTFAGTLTTAGALTAFKVVLITCAGTLTTAGTLVRKPLKIFSGTFTSAGALAIRLSVFKTFTGTLTTAGALIKKANKTFAGTLTTSGSLSNAFATLRHTPRILIRAGDRLFQRGQRLLRDEGRFK